MDLAILFLILLGLTGILFLWIFAGGINAEQMVHIIQGLVFVPVVLLTVTLFFILLFKIDYRNLILVGVDRISSRTVSFISAVPPELANTIRANRVERHDTDGDQFEEWVVFYEYELQNDKNPVQVTIYDNDRGNPPVIFPYQLRVPDRDYLSELPVSVSFTLNNIVPDTNGPNGGDTQEILVQDGKQLSIFKYNGKYDTQPWDPPSDSPPRYSAIGAFKGTGKVSIDLQSDRKDVTVINRDPYDRSQLAERSIYGINLVTNTYWDDFDSTHLAAPIISTVDFYPNPPENIANTTYPEKVVLAFYASTCGQKDDTLCTYAGQWTPEQFLVPDDVAWNELKNPAGGPAYFGLNSFTKSQNLQVKDIRYYPALEAATAQQTNTGPRPRANVVDITFTVDGGLDEARSCTMMLTDGKWKISECVPSNVIISENTGNPSFNTSAGQ